MVNWPEYISLGTNEPLLPWSFFSCLNFWSFLPSSNILEKFRSSKRFWKACHKIAVLCDPRRKAGQEALQEMKVCHLLFYTSSFEKCQAISTLISSLIRWAEFYTSASSCDQQGSAGCSCCFQHKLGEDNTCPEAGTTIKLLCWKYPRFVFSGQKTEPPL